MFANVNRKTPSILSFALLFAMVALAIVFVVEITPTSPIDQVKETSQEVDHNDNSGNDNDFWLKQSDPMEAVLDHEDDQEVLDKAKDEDIKNGMSPKGIRRSDKETTEENLKEAKQVDADMKKQVLEERAEEARDKKEQEDTESTIREIYDVAYHQKRENERKAKRLKRERLAEKRRLEGLRRVARTEVMFKQDCKSLRKIMDRANPKHKSQYAKTCKGL